MLCALFTVSLLWYNSGHMCLMFSVFIFTFDSGHNSLLAFCCLKSVRWMIRETEALQVPSFGKLLKWVCHQNTVIDLQVMTTFVIWLEFPREQ